MERNNIKAKTYLRKKIEEDKLSLERLASDWEVIAGTKNLPKKAGLYVVVEGVYSSFFYYYNQNPFYPVEGLLTFQEFDDNSGIETFKNNLFRAKTQRLEHSRTKYTLLRSKLKSLSWFTNYIEKLKTVIEISDLVNTQKKYLTEVNLLPVFSLSVQQLSRWRRNRFI